MASINGTPGDDDFIGTNSGDTITGIGGNDTLSGLGGADTLEGGDGDDTLDGKASTLPTTASTARASISTCSWASGVPAIISRWCRSKT